MQVTEDTDPMGGTKLGNLEVLDKLPARVKRSAIKLYRLYERRTAMRSVPVLSGICVVGLGCSLEHYFASGGLFVVLGALLAVPVCYAMWHYTKPIDSELTLAITEEVERAESLGLRDQLTDLVISHPQLWEFVATLYHWN